MCIVLHYKVKVHFLLCLASKPEIIIVGIYLKLCTLDGATCFPSRTGCISIKVRPPVHSDRHMSKDNFHKDPSTFSSKPSPN